MTDEEILNSIVHQYGLETRIPEAVKNHILSSRDRNLKRILRKTGNYSIVIALLCSLFLLLKKAGLSISFLQTAIITGIITTVTALTITGGAVISVIDTINDSSEIVSPENEYATIINSGSFENKLMVMTFLSSEGSKDAEKQFRSALVLNLLKLRGGENIVTPSRGTKDSYIVTGSVDRLPQGYLITTRIINPADGVIVFYDLSEIRSINQIPETCAVLAGRISEKIK